MRELEHEFERELVVVGVHSAKFPAEKEPANLRAAVQRLELHHPVINDADFEIWQQYAVRAWPTLIFVDPRGYVFGKHEGEFPLAPVRELLADAVARYDAKGAVDRAPLPLDPLPPGGGTLRFPGNVLADAVGDRLFVADSGHNRVLVAGFDGRITARFGSGEPGFADGLAHAVRFDHPQGLALDADAATLYVADAGNHAVRAVELASGRVTTVAGTGARGYDRAGGGPGPETALASPWDVELRDGQLWIAMAGSHQLWTLDLWTGRAAVAAGTGAESIHDGPLAKATFAQPSGLSRDPRDDVLYAADSETSAVRRVDPGVDRVRRLLGRGLFDFGDVDGVGDRVRLQHPLGIEAASEDGATVVYLADTYNHKLKRLAPATRRVDTLAGGGPGHADGDLAAARFWEPSGLSVGGRRLYVADTNNHAVRVVDLDAGTVRKIQFREG